MPVWPTRLNLFMSKGEFYFADFPPCTSIASFSKHGARCLWIYFSFPPTPHHASLLLILSIRCLLLILACCFVCTPNFVLAAWAVWKLWRRILKLKQRFVPITFASPLHPYERWGRRSGKIQCKFDNVIVFTSILSAKPNPQVTYDSHFTGEKVLTTLALHRYFRLQSFVRHTVTQPAA